MTDTPVDAGLWAGSRATRPSLRSRVESRERSSVHVADSCVVNFINLSVSHRRHLYRSFRTTFEST